MFKVWLFDLLWRGPKFRSLQSFFSVSPAFREAEQKSDAEYLPEGFLSWISGIFLVKTDDLMRIQDPELFKSKLCDRLMQSSKLGVISIWNPNYLEILLDQLPTPAEPLWPELDLISCWGDHQAGAAFERLKKRFPGVFVQAKGLLATEGPMTLPLIRAQGCVPLVGEVFYEFESESGAIRLMHEVEVGETYELILTLSSGFPRYRIGDRVRVTHFYGKLPCLKFVGRGEKVSDLVGEKLNEEYALQCLKKLGWQDSFPLLIAHEDRYILLIDILPEPKEASERLDAELCRAVHFAYARKLGQLKPTEVRVVPGLRERYYAYHMGRCMKWGDIKNKLLVTDLRGEFGALGG